ncbi:MAG TPA: YebC/PmpR family DNA-binding transcriptional regulator [Patescibacteria group bacterium]|nr:YebC/PmpR family DNA-binding transcriptional regulator [Patescibacteria group bacterium]
MSGHSKWSTIKRKKEAKDIKRGNLFTKLGNAIALAAKEGGGDPDSNFKLRLAIEKAQTGNMPKEKIKMAIERGAGVKNQGGDLAEIVYEGYGPQGIAVLVDVTTDNRQKTAAEMKFIFDRGGGTLSGPGSVSYLFRKRGVVTVKTEGKTEDALLSAAVTAGAEDIEYDEEETMMYTNPKDLMKVEESLKAQGLQIVEAELSYQPTTYVQITDPEAVSKVLSFMEKFEESDEVQKVHANFDIPKELLPITE